MISTCALTSIIVATVRVFPLVQMRPLVGLMMVVVVMLSFGLGSSGGRTAVRFGQTVGVAAVAAG